MTNDREKLRQEVAEAICMNAGCVWDCDPQHSSRREWDANAYAAIAIVLKAAADVVRARAADLLVTAVDADRTAEAILVLALDTCNE